MRTLDVYCLGRLAGELAQTPDGLRFSYDDHWIEAGMPPISQSLPAEGTLPSDAVRAFFSGLLPEGEPRRRLARRLGTSARNDFALLAAIGGDCPGAISLVPPGHGAPTVEQGGDVRWLAESELAELIATLPERPMLAAEDGEIRLSLAGAQDKLPVVASDDGRIGITTGRTPSTHILKTRIPRFSGTVVNEAFCLALGRRLDIPTVSAEPRRVDGTDYLLVTRYDREVSERHVHRLHQEDFCQALGVAPELKYEADGGPPLAACFGLVERATSVFASSTQRLFDAVALNFLVGNHDAHAKNFSLLYRPEGSVELAPFYDILSTVVYAGLSRKMAMRIGGEYRPDYVRSRHLDGMLVAAQLGPAPARRRLRRLAEAAPSVARTLRDEFAADGWDDPILDTILVILDRRSAQLRDVAFSG
jgi:serine/threonine-protein kinase HipA